MNKENIWSGETSLFIVCENRNKEIVENLVECRADINNDKIIIMIESHYLIYVKVEKKKKKNDKIFSRI